MKKNFLQEGYSRAYNLSREEFNGVVGRFAPHNTALKYKPILERAKRLILGYIKSE